MVKAPSSAMSWDPPVLQREDHRSVDAISSGGASAIILGGMTREAILPL